MDQKASQTALLVAAYRGRASAKPDAICHDAWALALAGTEGAKLAAEFDVLFPHMELWMAVRTAYLDAHVASWTRAPHAFAQVVLLGAGLDTRAARLAAPGVRFFEVDHPATQADKKRRLGALTAYPGDAATYVACDFEVDDFLTRLEACGFRPNAPALFLWEGVTPYLQETAVRATLRRVAEGCDARTVLLFDHLRRPKADRVEHTYTFVDQLGEKVLFGTNDPLPMLYEEGFRHVHSVSFDAACLTLTGTYARQRQFRFQHMVLASRSPLALLPA